MLGYTKRWTNRFFPYGWSNPTKLALILFFANLYFYLPVSTLYLQSKGLNYVQINSLWGIIVGTMFLAEVPTGVIADRIGRARSVQIALAFQVAGEAIFLFANGYLLFAAAAVAGGLGFAFSSGSAEALVYDSLVDRNQEEEMAKAMGFISAAHRLANLIAFSLAALLIVELNRTQFQMAIAVTTAMVLVGWAISLTLRDSETHDLDDRIGWRDLLRDGMETLRNNRNFRRLVLLALATIPFADYLLNLYQPRFVEVGVPTTWLGLGLALASLLSIAGARQAYLMEKHLGSARSLLLVTALPGLFYLLFAATFQPLWSVLIFCLLFASMSLKDPLFSGHLNRHIRSSSRATLLSMINMVSGLYVALMGLVIGYIADLSLTVAFLFMGVVILLGAFLFRVGHAEG